MIFYKIKLLLINNNFFKFIEKIMIKDETSDLK